MESTGGNVGVGTGVSTNGLNELAKYIFSDKYARYNDSQQRRETWEEACNRVRNMHLKRFDSLDGESKNAIINAFEYVKAKRAVPSMRSMQFGGQAVEAKNERIFNCAVRHIDSLRSFAEIFYLLLCGCGVGIGLSEKFMSRLPKLVNREAFKIDGRHNTHTHYVMDTVEGWADALEILLKSFFEGNEFSGVFVRFNYTLIRPKGSPLKTAGGKAPGPDGLRNALDRINTLMWQCVERQSFTTLDAFDVNCHAADAVLSGGVRRSALSVVFKPEDKLMFEAKIGDWRKDNPQRARGNISVLLLRNEVTPAMVEQIIRNARQWGEPGFVFAEHPDTLFNPCFEISFIPVTESGECGVQFCVAGNTKLITRNGLETIEDVVGKTIEIWNGQQWSEVTPFQTGESDTLHRVYFGDGSYLDATDNHKFLVKESNRQSEFVELETLDLIKLLEQGKKLHVPRANVTDDPLAGNDEAQAYEYGFILGDGYVDGKKICASLFKDDKKLPFRGTYFPRTYTNSYGTVYWKIAFSDVHYEFSTLLKASKTLPPAIFSWNSDSLLRFFAGWIDADGSKANGGCRLYGTEERLRDSQLLLTKLGIVSSINLCQSSGSVTNFGARKQDLWYLQIPDARKIPSRRLDLSSGKPASHKGKFQTIKKVVTLEGQHKSYCLTEEQLHQCLFNNVLTKQCNLSSVNGSMVKSAFDFYKAVEVATIIGTLQASYTHFPYLSATAKELTESESLLGVSITAMMDNPDILLDPEIQRDAAKLAVAVNRYWAVQLGIRPASRVTCIKPEGTGTLALGSVSNGIHAAHARRMFKRVQANRQDPIYQAFKAANPHHVEPSVWSANDTDDVITLPIELPPTVKTKSELTAREHLEIVRSTQNNWVRIGGMTGRNDKPLSHNVSCTIVVAPNEWDEVAEYLFAYKDSFSAVSLLAASGDKDYPQMPNEAVSTPEDEERFNFLMETLAPVDYTQVKEYEDITAPVETLSCAGGQCEIVYA